MLRSTMLAISRNSTVRRGMVAFPPTKRVVDRFVAGEELDECMTTLHKLAESGLLTTVDYLGEDTLTLEQAEAAVTECERLIARIADEGLTATCEVSIKLTSMGLMLNDGTKLATNNALRIAQAAARVGTCITIDMEDHTVTDATLDVLRAVRQHYPNTGGVLQAYLKRTAADCEDFAGAGSRIRLCKGAYDEPESVAFRDKADVDASYKKCLRILMKGTGIPMCATHDPAMIDAALAYADMADRPINSYEIQMLYGIRFDEQVRLAEMGHKVRVYVPYGHDWYGYFTRRLAERPANMAFFLRALVGK